VESLWQFTGSLPHLTERPEAIDGNEPGALCSSIFKISFKVTLLDVTAHRPR